ncbi:hydroxymethylglutaryl-CoA reductase (NADPH) [Fusarium oxysporum f. sp. radicis-lycopersici 26381]|nr:hydroxymethylglutaryl-CoA reductase (NADPH) [Fusarium oxysporum f. sp. radicis-lycopersici 26381]
MLGFLPKLFRRAEYPDEKPDPPSKANKKITPILQYIASISCNHPLYTICVIAVLASTTYVGIVKNSLYGATVSVRQTEWSSLAQGSSSVFASPETSWEWQSFDPRTQLPANANHLALLTLVFAESSQSPQVAPQSHDVPIPSNLAITHLPSSSNSSETFSQDTALTFAVNYGQAPQFVAAVQKVPYHVPEQHLRETVSSKEGHKMWIMKVISTKTRRSWVRWAHNAVYKYIDLLNNAKLLDVGIVFIGYLSMYSTFLSLFWRMRCLGSNAWLARGVLLSSVFAFIFGLHITQRLGVPINIVHLLEAFPLFVNVVGFRKSILLARAVLSHASNPCRLEEKDAKTQQFSAKWLRHEGVIHRAVQRAVEETGFEIVKSYAIEISLITLGSASGLHRGLRQFSSLFVWVLFFEGILLFTFYTAILCIKLEVYRVKRYAGVRSALKDDVSCNVAKSVANSSDWLQGNGKDNDDGSHLLNRDMENSNIPKFKFWAVATFFTINIANTCMIPFRTPGAASAWASGLGRVTNTPPVDPIKVASNALDKILFTARGHVYTTVVTVLEPITYELDYHSDHWSLLATRSSAGDFSKEFMQLHEYGVGGQLVSNVIKSLENPALTGCVIGALFLGTILNAYLFKVARSSIKDPNERNHPIDPQDPAKAERFNNAQSSINLALPHGMSRSKALLPSSTDDEADALSMKKSAKPALGLTKLTNMPHGQLKLDEMLKENRIYDMTDDEIVALSLRGKIAGHSLERSLKDCTRAVKIRRTIIARNPATADVTGFLDRCKLPYDNYDWERVLGACCENVIGYMPVPVGVAGPIVIDGKSYFVPMATTEGVLVASTSRGCKAINASGGATTVLTHDGMTRGPCVGFETLDRAGAAKLWLDSDIGQNIMKEGFNSTSRFARLLFIKTAIAGTNLYIRFKATTGDAMGMNMISKGVENALSVMATKGGFGDMVIISLSGNYCTDKKAAAINWIEGRGKGVVAEAIIPPDIVKSILKSNVESLVELNISKNLIGSAMAGSLGGFNAHASNIIAAIFIATGQDPAQVVESSNCITLMRNFHGALQISVSMPSIEVGTIGGGTILEPQGAMLDMFGVRGSHPTSPGDNARRLARIIGATVLAGELSLCSALAAGHLVQAHMAHNRTAPAAHSTVSALGTSRAMTPGPGVPAISS